MQHAKKVTNKEKASRSLRDPDKGEDDERSFPCRVLNGARPSCSAWGKSVDGDKTEWDAKELLFSFHGRRVSSVPPKEAGKC